MTSISNSVPAKPTNFPKSAKWLSELEQLLYDACDDQIRKGPEICARAKCPHNTQTRYALSSLAGRNILEASTKGYRRKAD